MKRSDLSIRVEEVDDVLLELHARKFIKFPIEHSFDQAMG